LQQLKLCTLRSPAPCWLWLWLGPPTPTPTAASPSPSPSPFCPGAHLSCPQRPTVLARALAVTGCRAAAHMGKKAKHGSPAGRGREGQGALPLSKITACMHTVRSTELSTEVHARWASWGCRPLLLYCTTVSGGVLRRAGAGAGCWSLDGVPHREHCSPGASTPCLTKPPLPGHSHSGPRILRGYAYHPRDNKTLPAREYSISGDGSLWPLLFARFKTWLLQTCWKTQTVIWRLFLTRES